MSVAPASAPLIAVRGLSYSYPATRGGAATLDVVQDVDFELRAGEVLTVIGPSGCGKTTLLRLIAGLVDHRYATGSVEVAGRPVTGPSPELGYVFQQMALIPWRTVRRNVEFAVEARQHRRPNTAEREEIARIIEFVGLAGFEDYHPNQLSGGMQQRVGIARALATAPSCLLMDEPFGALDAQNRRIFQDELLRWRERGFAVVLVTHDLDEAVYLSDRILVMSARPGRILEQITVDLPPRTGIDQLRRLDSYREILERMWTLLLPENIRATGTG